MHPSNRIADLIFLYQTGELTKEQELELMTWVDASADNRAVFDQLTDTALMGSHLKIRDKIETGIDSHRLPQRKVVSIGGWKRYAAASVLLLGALGLTLYYLKGIFTAPVKLHDQNVICHNLLVKIHYSCNQPSFNITTDSEQFQCPNCV